MSDNLTAGCICWSVLNYYIFNYKGYNYYGTFQFTYTLKLVFLVTTAYNIFWAHLYYK